MAKLTRVDRKAAKRKNNLLEVKDSCVNCGQHIALDQRFCSFCGGKRIYNRLTWRNLIEDFANRFLNLENSFLKTFVALFRQPEDVIGGYMNGMRKKYLPAFSYFAIAITIAGVYAFIIKTWFFDDLFNAQSQMAVGPSMPGQDEITKKVTQTLMDYQSVIYFVFIPVMALISKLVFLKNKKYNLVEHFVIYLYAYSHIAIVTMILGLFTLWSPTATMIFGFAIYFIYIGYIAFVLKRVFVLDTFQIILKTALFLLILIGVSAVVMIGAMGIGIYAARSGALDDIEFVKQIKEQKIRERENAMRVKDSLVQDSLNQLESTLELTPEIIRDTSQKE